MTDIPVAGGYEGVAVDLIPPSPPVPALAPPRSGPREPGDFVLGCGQPPPGKVNGRVCAGTGKELSCKLCPESPTYHRKTEGQPADA